jgi:hypothetical protein
MASLKRRPRHRWEDNIKMDFREIRFGNVDWIHLSHDGESVSCCEDGNGRPGSIKYGEFLS